MQRDVIVIEKIQKELFARAKWVLKAKAGKGYEHRSFFKVLVKNGVMVATDSRRLHLLIIENCSYTDGIYELVCNDRNKIVMLHSGERLDSFPDYKPIINIGGVKLITLEGGYSDHTESKNIGRLYKVLHKAGSCEYLNYKIVNDALYPCEKFDVYYKARGNQLTYNPIEMISESGIMRAIFMPIEAKGE